MAEKRMNQPERRHSIESRLDLLEYQLMEMKAVVNEVQDDRAEVLRILQKLETEQEKTKSFVGGAGFLISGVAACVWYFGKEFFNKLLH